MSSQWLKVRLLLAMSWYMGYTAPPRSSAARGNRLLLLLLLLLLAPEAPGGSLLELLPTGLAPAFVEGLVVPVVPVAVAVLLPGRRPSAALPAESDATVPAETPWRGGVGGSRGASSGGWGKGVDVSRGTWPPSSTWPPPATDAPFHGDGEPG